MSRCKHCGADIWHNGSCWDHLEWWNFEMDQCPEETMPEDDGYLCVFDERRRRRGGPLVRPRPSGDCYMKDECDWPDHPAMCNRQTCHDYMPENCLVIEDERKGRR